MGKKYIIELEEPEMFDERKYYQCSQMPWWAVSENIVENLTPYAEPDLDAIRKEAYDKGYTDAAYNCHERCAFLNDAKKEAYQRGYETAKHECEDCTKPVDNGKAYQMGLNDAWEAARKIASDNAGRNYSIFGQHFTVEILNTHSASESIEKIRQYEQEKEEEIQVGDEVIRHYKNEFMEGDDAPSIFLSEEDGHFRCLAFNGRSIMIAEYPKNQYRKTGRHFPEIAEVLQKMKES